MRTTTLNPIFMLIAWMVFALSAQSVGAANLFSDDFEGHTVGAALEDDASWEKATAFSSNVEDRNIRDENTATPFGTPNQYVEIIDDSGSNGLEVRTANLYAATYDALTTFSFDFHEPTGGGDGNVQFGYTATRLTSGERRAAFTLNNGTVLGLTGVDDNTYDLDTVYTIYLVLNDSLSATNYNGRTIAAETAHVWLQESGSLAVYAGSRAAFNSRNAGGYAVAVTTFSGDLQTLYFDNVLIETGAPDALRFKPDMQVLVDGSEIAAGATNALPVTTTGTTITRTYTITNLTSATTNLYLTNSPAVVFSESGTTNYNSFTIITNITGAATNLAAGDSEPFTIQFVTNALGSYTGTVSIANSDTNKNPYTFVVTAEVTPPQPSMQVRYDEVEIEVGVTNTLSGALPDTPVSRTYVVTNLTSATDTLLLTNSPAVVFSESGTTNYNGFTIITNITGTATNLAAGDAESFTVQFVANVVGTYTGTVSIANNDTDKDPYTFVVRAVNEDPRIYLLRSNDSGVDDWDTVEDWSDGLAPSGDKDYVVYSNLTLRTPNDDSGEKLFAGGSLTIGDATQGAGTLALQGNGVTTINNLTLERGTIATFRHTTTHSLQSSQDIPVGSSFAFRSGSSTGPTTIEIDPVLTGTGNIVIDGRDDGNFLNYVQFNAANTYSGTVRMRRDATLIVGHANAVQNLTLDMQAGDSGTVTFNQNSTVGGLTGTRDIDFDTYTISVGNNDEDTSYSGAISNGSLTKMGSGVLTLSGDNAYTGATTVDEGTLRVNGSLAAGSAVTVNSGGILAGTGTVGGSVTIASGGTFLADGTALTVGGALTLDSGSEIDASGFTPTDPVLLMHYDSLSGTFSTVDVPEGWVIDYAYAGNATIALVPAIRVLYDGSEIASGATNALSPTTVDVAVQREYVVANLSAGASLLLTGSPAVVFAESGTTSYNGFTITANITGADTNLAAGASEPFTIEFLSGAFGSYSATVRIANTVADRNPYTFEVTVEVISISPDSEGDSIVGRRQVNASELGYHTNAANSLVGMAGSTVTDTRECRNLVMGYTLPTLPAGKVVSGATLTFEITAALDKATTDPSLNVYILTNAAPETTGTDLYYHGPSNSTAAAKFVGSTYVEAGVDQTNVNQEVSYSLSGEALNVLKRFYNADHTPDVTEAFFRFNLDQVMPAINSDIQRYYINVAEGASTLTIIHADPPPTTFRFR